MRPNDQTRSVRFDTQKFKNYEDTQTEDMQFSSYMREQYQQAFVRHSNEMVHERDSVSGKIDRKELSVENNMTEEVE